MKAWPILALVISVIATADDGGALTVTQVGQMREVMREGHTEARVALSDVVTEPHAFAVGALKGLEGEITIIDGEAWVSRAVDGELVVNGPRAAAQDQATLLTLAYVDEWASVAFTESLEGAELDAFIAEQAAALGLDTTEPFPFLISGVTSGLDVHVVNGYCPIATNPKAMDTQPWRWSADKECEVVIVGFYAPNAAGVMTHHGTSIHAHAVVTDGTENFAGHVDRVVAEAGMTLLFPKVK